MKKLTKISSAAFRSYMAAIVAFTDAQLDSSG